MFIIEILEETWKLFLEMAPYLMLGLVFVGLLNLLFTKQLVVKYLGKDNFWSVLKASIFGVPLPLCSCGVVPSAVYMSKNGASKSSVVSFLISTPQTGIDSILATYGMMGWLFAIYRPIAALAMGFIGGSALNILKPKQSPNINFKTYDVSDDDCEDDDCESCGVERSDVGGGKTSKIKKTFKYAFVDFLDDISKQFVVGLFIAGIISYSIPDGFFEGGIVTDGIIGMLLMILVGAPMYVCATASIPIAVALILKGFSPGVAFVFLAVGPATNAASFTIIAKTLGKKTASLYVALISVTAIGAGLLLDQIFQATGIDPVAHLKTMHGHGGLLGEEISYVVSAIFLVLLILSLYRLYFKKDNKTEEKTMEAKKFEIEGMSCNHCVMNVKNAIEKVEGVESVEVSLNDNAAYVKGKFDEEALKNAVSDVGYEVKN